MPSRHVTPEYIGEICRQVDAAIRTRLGEGRPTYPNPDPGGDPFRWDEWAKSIGRANHVIAAGCPILCATAKNWGGVEVEALQALGRSTSPGDHDEDNLNARLLAVRRVAERAREKRSAIKLGFESEPPAPPPLVPTGSLLDRVVTLRRSLVVLRDLVDFDADDDDSPRSSGIEAHAFEYFEHAHMRLGEVLEDLQAVSPLAARGEHIPDNAPTVRSMFVLADQILGDAWAALHLSSLFDAPSFDLTFELCWPELVHLLRSYANQINDVDAAALINGIDGEIGNITTALSAARDQLRPASAFSSAPPVDVEEKVNVFAMTGPPPTPEWLAHFVAERMSHPAPWDSYEEQAPAKASRRRRRAHKRRPGHAKRVVIRADRERERILLNDKSVTLPVGQMLDVAFLLIEADGAVVNYAAIAEAMGETVQPGEKWDQATDKQRPLISKINAAFRNAGGKGKTFESVPKQGYRWVKVTAA